MSTDVNNPSHALVRNLSVALNYAKGKQAHYPEPDELKDLPDGFPLSNALVQTTNRALHAAQRLEEVQ